VGLDARYLILDCHKCQMAEAARKQVASGFCELFYNSFFEH